MALAITAIGAALAACCYLLMPGWLTGVCAGVAQAAFLGLVFGRPQKARAD
jgi:hypothetical protein